MSISGPDRLNVVEGQLLELRCAAAGKFSHLVSELPHNITGGGSPSLSSWEHSVVFPLKMAVKV